MRADGISLPRLAAGIAIPALLAGLTAALLLKPEASRILQASHASSPHFLSREADLPVPAGGPLLHPIVIRGGRAALGRDAPVAASGAARPAPPARITIRSVGLAASVVPVQAARNGDIGVPPPGSAGHLAAFGRIASVRDGAQIKVTDAAGRVHAFQVVGRAQTRKSAFPRDDVYGASQHPVLVLITCGGKWLGRQHGGYRDNILVFARSTS